MSPATIYPAHLPPQPGFHYLSTAEMADQGRYLHRALDKPLTHDPGDGLISADLVCIPGSKQLLDYSVNVLGTFEIADGAWKARHQPWQPGETVQNPADIGQRSPYDWYGVLLSHLHGQSIVCLAVGDEMVVRCCVCHDPTHANYWHFAIRFANESGTSVQKLDLSNSKIKKMIADLRAWFRSMVGRQSQQLAFDALGPVPFACCQHRQPNPCP